MRNYKEYACLAHQVRINLFVIRYLLFRCKKLLPDRKYLMSHSLCIWLQNNLELKLICSTVQPYRHKFYNKFALVKHLGIIVNYNTHLGHEYLNSVNMFCKYVKSIFCDVLLIKVKQADEFQHGL